MITYTPPPGTLAQQPQTMPSQPTPTQTMASPNSSNPLILLGGFAVIAMLVVAVVFIVINPNASRPASEAPTTAPTTAAPTRAPVAAQPTLASITPTMGTVSYMTGDFPGDSVNVVVNGLVPPLAQQTYTVWLSNLTSDNWLKVGDLRLDPLGNGQLSFHGSPMLPALYNAVLITQESGDSDTPSDKVVYSGSVPPELMDALTEILITSPDGIPGMKPAMPFEPGGAAATAEADGDHSSLLDGALAEAKIAQQHAGLAAGSTSIGGVHSHAEHTINILNGTQIDYNGDGSGQNPGRGYGIAYFTDRIRDKLSAVANAPSASMLVQSQVELIGVCIDNVQNWMGQVVDLETQFINASDLDSIHDQLAQSTQLTDAIINGIDLNQNGRVEPFEGECGLQQIKDFGISVGNITISAGSLSQGE